MSMRKSGWAGLGFKNSFCLGMFTSSSETVSSPEILSVSRGSSVTTGLREEYEDLLRYAVVTPVLNTDVGGFPLIATTKSGGPPPRTSPPPKPYIPPQYITRAEMKEKVSKVELDDTHSELSGAPPLSSVTAQLPSATSPPPKFLPLQTEDLERSSTRDESHDYEDDDSHKLVNNPKVAQLETKMDAWCLDLKRNVLVEFEQAEILMTERHQAELMKERQRHAHEIEQLKEELEHYKELMVIYEQSVARKDDIISNLTKALQKQKDHVKLQHTFNSWKFGHVNDKWESFTSTLAKRHHHHKLMSRVCAAWFGLVQGRWKQRVEKACQSKAEEVCVQLTGQYKEQVTNIQQSLDNCQQEVARLKVERNLYEENMKKAFMRGVCALNLEAMTMFQNHNAAANEQQNHGEGHYIHGGSETGLESQRVPLKSQAGYGSKRVLVTTSTAVPPSSQSRHAQTSSNSSKKTMPAVTVEKH